MQRQALKLNHNRKVMLANTVSKRNYNSLIERQSEMHLIGMDTTCALTLIETLHLDYGLSMPQSIICLQACARLVQMPLQTFLFSKLTRIDS